MENKAKVVVCVLLVAVVFCGLGFYLGRLYPAHNYQRFGQSRYLFDTKTGKFCTMVVPTNPIDDALGPAPGQYPVCGR
jgi:hypothetical protein